MDYWHKAWQCPYFRWDDRLVVGCEGGKLHFADKQSAVEYMGCFCAHKTEWKRCSIAANLTKYYDRRENKS